MLSTIWSWEGGGGVLTCYKGPVRGSGGEVLVSGLNFKPCHFAISQGSCVTVKVLRCSRLARYCLSRKLLLGLKVD